MRPEVALVAALVAVLLPHNVPGESEVVLTLKGDPGAATTVIDVYAPDETEFVAASASGFQAIAFPGGVNFRGRAAPATDIAMFLDVAHPVDATLLYFRVLQTLENGTVISWTDPPGGARPVFSFQVPAAPQPAPEPEAASSPAPLIVAVVVAVVVVGGVIAIIAVRARRYTPAHGEDERRRPARATSRRR